MKRFVFIVLFLNCILFSFVGNLNADVRRVRVAILKNADNVVLATTGKYKIVNNASQEILSGRNFRKTVFEVENGYLKFSGSKTGLSSLRFYSSKSISLYLNGKLKRFRGFLELIAQEDDTILAVNHLDLERYIKGVLYHEVSHRWPLSAIKAQAVAVRTYTLYHMNESEDLDYDVTSDIYSQVYGGKTAERYRTSLAVKRTQYQVMTFEGKVIPAYYHSNCGGHTEDASVLWKHNIKPLGGVKDSFCEGLPNYTWKKNIQSSDVQAKLNAKGKKIGLIKSIAIENQSKSGRAVNLKITDRSGQSMEIPANEFRLIVGPNLIKSNFYEIDMKGYYFDLKGRGWGHGVGMCQWGAFGMSKQRYNYTEILKHYYPGVDIVKYRSSLKL